MSTILHARPPLTGTARHLEDTLSALLFDDLPGIDLPRTFDPAIGDLHLVAEPQQESLLSAVQFWMESTARIPTSSHRADDFSLVQPLLRHGDLVVFFLSYQPKQTILTAMQAVRALGIATFAIGEKSVSAPNADAAEGGLLFESTAMDKRTKNTFFLVCAYLLMLKLSLAVGQLGLESVRSLCQNLRTSLPENIQKTEESLTLFQASGKAENTPSHAENAEQNPHANTGIQTRWAARGMARALCRCAIGDRADCREYSPLEQDLPRGVRFLAAALTTTADISGILQWQKANYPRSPVTLVSFASCSSLAAFATSSLLLPEMPICCQPFSLFYALCGLR